MTIKITLNDLKLAEHLLVENCIKIVKIFFQRNINGNMIKHSRAGLVKVSAKSKPISLDHFPCFLLVPV
jgi:hypothetical protein